MRSFLFAFLLLATNVFSQKNLLQSGPMLGYADMKEVLLWAQTKSPAKVCFEYWDIESPNKKLKTETVFTQKQTGFTAKCVADQVEPGKTYEYRLLINKKRVDLPYPTRFKTQTLWQWRTDPPAFSVATGSCAYVNEKIYDRPGKPYGSNYQTFTSIYNQKPDLMLWLGDNVYYREPDWSTATGMYHRYTHDRSLPELQPLLASANHYAIWDDHDFGPNDSDGAWIHKETAHEVFKNFWGNPTFGLPGKKGCTTKFQHADIDFFLLDNRYERSANNCKTCPRTALGPEQLDWLIASLSSSYAPFKLVAVGNQLITTNLDHETHAHFFKAERDSILARIERENIKGVIFLTGDRHFTELSALKNARGNWVHDLTVSPLTSGPTTNPSQYKNDFRVEGTLVEGHNFATLNFSGPRKDRQMQIKVFDANGRQLWEKTLKAKEL